jgi:type IV fimbrial biogenesis protein FimT
MTVTANYQHRRFHGFTMVELLVTIAIATILTTVAIPSFSGLIASQRAKTAASELFASLLTARSDAIMRNANVTVSPLAGGWGQGWQILDLANNVLETHGALTNVIIPPTGGVTFRPSGRVTAASASMFQISTTSGSSTNYQCISLNLSGRPYIQAAQTC